MNQRYRSIFSTFSIAASVLVSSACTPGPDSGTSAPGAGPTTADSPVVLLDVGESTSASINDKVTGGASGVVAQLVAESSRPEVVVYKSATCGCCKDWVAYLEDEGFAVKAIDHDNVDQIKSEHGLTNSALKSCHTALVDGYVIEGHVPVADIDRLLAERPDVVGLTAPGMPMNSPGMNSLIPKDYDVLAFRKDGSSRIFSSY